MNQRFVTVKKLEDGHWIVEASGDSTHTAIEKKIEYLPQGLYDYTKIGKKIAKDLNLPFFRANETPEEKYRKEKRRVAKRNHRKSLDNQIQNSLKQEWLEWSSRFSSEQKALAEGIWACEQLARDLGSSITSQTDDYYMFSKPEMNKDLMRLVQFNELKKLWLKRNQKNILEIKKLPYDNPPRFYRFGFNEFYEETFFSYFDNVQLYLYEVVIEAQNYILFSEQVLNLPCKSEEKLYSYKKQLSTEVKQKIGKSFHLLVPIIEWGARNFWQKYWSKKESKLLLSV